VTPGHDEECDVESGIERLSRVAASVEVIHDSFGRGTDADLLLGRVG